MSNIEKIVRFFHQHPKFPFNRCYSDYDEYTAAHLMATYIVKSYILEGEQSEWRYVSSYIDVRRCEPELRKSIVSCINNRRGQVFFFSLYDSRDLEDEFDAIEIGLIRDDFYGGKWETHAPIEEWYSVFEVLLNLNKLNNYVEVDQLLKTYFNNNLSFDKLQELKLKFSH